MDTLDYNVAMGIPVEIHALFEPDDFIDLSVTETVERARGIFPQVCAYFPALDPIDPVSPVGSYLGPLFVLATVWGPNPSAIGFWEWLGATTQYLYPHGIRQPSIAETGAPAAYLAPFLIVPDDIWDMDTWRPLVHQYPLHERLQDAARIAQMWRPSIEWNASDLALPLLALVLLTSPFAGNGPTSRAYFERLRQALRRPPGGGGPA